MVSSKNYKPGWSCVQRGGRHAFRLFRGGRTWHCDACGANGPTARAQREAYQRDPQADIDAATRYRQTEAGRQVHRATQARRLRSLPTIVILGRPFLGSHLHHLTPDVAVYVPAALHASVGHNLGTGRGMGAANARAMEFYERGGGVS